MDAVKARRGREGIDWSFIGDGPHKTLQDAFPERVWQFLIELNQVTNRQLHCAKRFRDYYGREFLYIHRMEKYSDEDTIHYCNTVLRCMTRDTTCEVHLT